MTRHITPRNLVAITYVLTAATISCYFLAANSSRALESTLSFRALLLATWLLGPLLLCAGIYASAVLDSSTTRSRTILSGCVNFFGIAGVFIYLWFFRTPDLPNSDLPVTIVLIVILGVPFTFLLTSRSILKKRVFGFIFGTVAAAIAWPFMAFLALGAVIGRWDDAGTALIMFAGFACPLVFAFAAGATFCKHRAGYVAGLVAGCVTLSVLAYSELRLNNFQLENSWIAFNLPKHDNFGFIFASELKILSIGLAVIAIVISAFRLIPARFAFRELPVQTRTWPGFAVCLAVLTTWFCYAVTPYRIPIAVDGPGGYKLRILHVEKDGLKFHETFVAVYKDGRFKTIRDDRQLFQYEFRQSAGDGVLPPNADQLVSSIIESPRSQENSIRPRTLRKWHAEGWYVVSQGKQGIQTFTSELGTVPPKQLDELFHDIERQDTKLTPGGVLRDVCLGFCYDPQAGLGFIYENSRCFTDTTGTHCQ